MIRLQLELVVSASISVRLKLTTTRLRYVKLDHWFRLTLSTFDTWLTACCDLDTLLVKMNMDMGRTVAVAGDDVRIQWSSSGVQAANVLM